MLGQPRMMLACDNKQCRPRSAAPMSMGAALATLPTSSSDCIMRLMRDCRLALALAPRPAMLKRVHKRGGVHKHDALPLAPPVGPVGRLQVGGERWRGCLWRLPSGSTYVPALRGAGRCSPESGRGWECRGGAQKEDECGVPSSSCPARRLAHRDRVSTLAVSGRRCWLGLKPSALPNPLPSLAHPPWHLQAASRRQASTPPACVSHHLSAAFSGPCHAQHAPQTTPQL